MLIAPNSIVQVAPHQVSSQLGDEVVILDVKNGIYYGLDEVGSVVWQQIQQPQVVGEIVRVVMDKFNVAQSQCERDVLTMLQQLADARLLITQ